MPYLDEIGIDVLDFSMSSIYFHYFDVISHRGGGLYLNKFESPISWNVLCLALNLTSGAEEKYFKSDQNYITILLLPALPFI